MMFTVFLMFTVFMRFSDIQKSSIWDKPGNETYKIITTEVFSGVATNTLFSIF